MMAAPRPAFRIGTLAVCAATLLAGCVLSQAEVGPEGSLDVFSLNALGPKRTLPDDWVIESDGGNVRGNISVEAQSGIATVTIKTGAERFVMARRTKATLLASPYIGWSWRMSGPSGREADIRLIVGFYGGNPESRSWGSEPLARLGTSLPPFDRAIAILWGQSALERGSFSTTSTIPEYIARGGSEHLEKWWTDNLDLADLYRRAWPNDRIERTRIMFVGFAASADSGGEAQFGDIVLYR
jgi:hypothetical protein